VSSLKKTIGETEKNLRVLDRQNEDLRASVTRFENEMRAKDKEISASQREVVRYKELLELANRENTQLSDGISKRDLLRQASVSEVDTLRSNLLEREREIETLQKEQNEKKGELEANMLRMNEMVKRLTGESEKSAMAVQKAISSSVRLCVVAPTVNVHVADKKMKFRSRYSSSPPPPPLPCLARLWSLSHFLFLPSPGAVFHENLFLSS
jgi:predicted  nucleic acid-binding Zn-ribbon protein